MLDFLLCLAAWGCLSLGLDRHHEDAWGQPAPPEQLRRQRWMGTGWLLASAVWACQPLPGASAALHLVQWGVALSVAALATTAVATRWPQRLPWIAPLSGAGALLAALWPA